MIRTATVTDVTSEGVWIRSGWLPAKTGPLPCFGTPQAGDAVLVVRTDDGETLAICGGAPGIPSGGGAGQVLRKNSATSYDTSWFTGFPISSTDNAVARFDGTGGALQNSGVTIDDSSRVVIPGAHPGLKVGDGTTHGTVQVNGAAGSFSSLQLLKGGLARWTLRRSGDTESGSNAGSDLELLRYGDTETPLSRLTINRATGKITLPDVGSTAGLEFGASGPRDMSGAGSPEGVVTAPKGSTWRRNDGGAGTTFWVKESGSGNTGWVAK